MFSLRLNENRSLLDRQCPSDRVRCLIKDRDISDMSVNIVIF